MKPEPPTLLQPAPAVAARWRVHRLHCSLGPHAAAWDTLNDRRFGSHPLLSARMVEGMLHHFGSGDEHLCVLEAGGVPQAMAILLPRSRWIWTTFRPSQAQIGCLLIPDSRALAGLVQSLPGWVLLLDLLCVDPQVSGHLEGPAPSFHRHHAQTMSVDITGDFEAYWSQRSQNLRKNMRRYVNRIENDGLALRHEVVTEAGAVAAAVERYAALESQGWKAREGTAIQLGTAQGAFYTELLSGGAGPQRGEVHELWLGERLAASRLLLYSGQSCVILKTTFDESLSKYAPGRVLLERVLSWHFARRAVRSVEFYTDLSADQLSWATASRPIYDMRLYRAGLGGGLVHAGRTLQRLGRQSADTADDEGFDVQALPVSAESIQEVAALFEQFVAERGIQASAEWFGALQRHVFPGEDCQLFVLRHQGVPVAALPMRRRGHWALALANFYTAAYEAPLSPWLRTPQLQMLVRGVRAHWPRVSSVSLGPMRPTSQPFLLLHEALENEGMVVLRYFRHANWTWQQPCGMDWADYMASRTGAVRSTVRRASRRFESGGGRIEVITGGERLAAGIAAYEQVYRASWKRHEQFPAFLREMMDACARRGCLRLGVAWLEDRPIAAQLWTVQARRAEIHKLAYAEAFKSMSPGTVLTAHMMEHALTHDGVTVVDYLSGDDAYKAEWMSHRGQQWGMVAHDPRRAGGLAALLRAMPGAVVRVLGLSRRRRSATR